MEVDICPYSSVSIDLSVPHIFVSFRGRLRYEADHERRDGPRDLHATSGRGSGLPQVLFMMGAWWPAGEDMWRAEYVV